MKTIFFQSSLPRAGSTLLQNILGQNPQIYVTPTSGVLELLYAARANYTHSPEFKAQNADLMKRGFLSFCNAGLLGFYESITDKPYVVDKSRGWGIHYNFLNLFYPNPKIICMIRDLTDIFSSFEKKFRENSHLDSNIVKHSELKGTSTEKRFTIWENSVPIGLALERLRQIINEGTAQYILFVKYENLTRNPREEINRIYSFLGLPQFEHDFDNISQITQEDDSVYGIFGDHTIQRRVVFHPSSSEIILGKELCSHIRSKYKWFYDYFCY